MLAIEPRFTSFVRTFIFALALVLPAPLWAAVIGPSLQEKLASAGPLDPVEVIVTFHGEGPPTSAQLDRLRLMGLTGVSLRALPMAGVLATRSQVNTLAGMSDVRSLWLNEQLEYENDDSTALTGVDRMMTDPRLRNAMGLPTSGKGIGIMINDSGIDATHPDLTFGHKTVQNVYAGTNLNARSPLLPIVWVEDVPDTDIGSGHGTHVAGTAAGTGAASGGQYAGVAPGAHLIGYGSGAVLLILDTLGAFDYALVNQIRYNIRVINNSWGSTGQIGQDFDPDDPTNIATKRLADRGVIVVFSAGNSGSLHGTITGNFKKAPWVVTVGSAGKNSTLAGSSSRGERVGGGGTVVIDGETYTWDDRPNVVAPGVDIVSAMANTNALANPVNLFYARASGTSMAAPHVAGVIALMLEANPALDWRGVLAILEDTASNLPGYAAWEVGGGMINAYAAVAAAKGVRDDFGLVQNLNRDLTAELLESELPGPAFSLFYSPGLAGTDADLRDIESFTVAPGLSAVVARAFVPDNTVALVLTDPNGNRYGSGVSLPALGPNIGVSAPAVPGEWTIEVRGIGGVSGVALDPLGLTTGHALPATINAQVSFFKVDDITGLNDIAGHPAQGMIEKAAALNLADSRDGGFFEPDETLTRAELANYLTMGAAIRQFRPTDGSDTFFDVSGVDLAAAEAVVTRGAPLRDVRHVQSQTVLTDPDGSYNPHATVARAELAYSLVQALGLQAIAEQVRQNLQSEPITAEAFGQRVPLEDDAEVPPALRGHVQLAIDLQLMRVAFSLVHEPFEPQPTLRAHFHPVTATSRAEYAFSAVNYLDRFRQGGG
jgi:serine protease AprX